MELTAFDTMILAAVLVAGGAGFLTGYLHVVIGFFGTVLGVVALALATQQPELVKLAEPYFENDRLAKAGAGLAVFAIVQVFFILIAFVLRFASDWARPDLVDRLFGFVLGAAQGFVMIVIFLLVHAVAYQYWYMDGVGGMRDSLTYPAVKAVGDTILGASRPFLPPDLAAAAARVRL